MAKLLFRLRGVPDDEATEVRELLDEHGFDYYETSAGNWGISLPALWLRDDDALPRARAVLDEYQARRAREAQTAWEEDLRQGRRPTQWRVLCQQPLKTVACLGAAGLVLYLSISIFFQL